jgi:predicted GNAT superfamily acetyltransferase
MTSIDPEGGVTIRELRGIDEMVRAEALQKSVWESASDYDHKDILVAIQHAGGLVAGAFTQEDEMVGFILAFPTLEEHGLHSHRLAVLPAHRRFRIGEKIKWFQHDWALEHGIKWIRWTYDPLQVINAHLNIHRLGAVVNTYYKNYYGLMDGINTGTPSDRILAVWYPNSPRVLACRNNTVLEKHIFEAVPANQVCEEAPCEEDLSLDNSFLRINLPHNNDLLVADINLALAWRFHVRRLLENYFSRGYCISHFTKMDGPAYILQQFEDLATNLTNN